MVHWMRDKNNENILIEGALLNSTGLYFSTTDFCALHIKAVQGAIWQKPDVLYVFVPWVYLAY